MSVWVTLALDRRRSVAAGSACLEGTTAIAGDPDTPVSRDVYLSVEQDAASARTRRGASKLLERIVSAADGTWRVNNLDPTRHYSAVAYDHTGQYDPATKGGLVPTPYTLDTDPTI
ncbi:MAG: hypothetical protein OQL08_09200 [Gammaproteobacteria bacterium]|nr:hypothetical protein [Gammaproteobacteria bacterium]